jgi:DNA (cytosine-5)-methyltransferase 1
MARDYKDPPVVAKEPCYIVRRLTPTECARLQGFPDWWCSELGTENPTDEELAFWADVFETHRKVMGTSKKPKTEKQIRKWLADPYSDSAEYRLWGNGVALPCVYFVLSGIVWAAVLDEQEKQLEE